MDTEGFFLPFQAEVCSDTADIRQESLASHLSPKMVMVFLYFSSLYVPENILNRVCGSKSAVFRKAKYPCESRPVYDCAAEFLFPGKSAFVFAATSHEAAAPAKYSMTRRGCGVLFAAADSADCHDPIPERFFLHGPCPEKP